jgi:hypothetical protein
MASRYMKVGKNVLNNRGYLAPNPEAKPQVFKKTKASKKANANPSNAKPANAKSPKKPSPKEAPKKKASLKQTNVPEAPKKKSSVKKLALNKNVKYRFNSPSNQVLSANNFEDLFKLEGKGESREEFKQKMK